MANKTLIVFVVFDLLFLACAALHLLIPIFTHAALGRKPTVANVASDLLLDHCPLIVSMVNSFIMFVVFLLSLPPLIFKKNRIFLVLHAWGIVAAGLVTLGIGLKIWFSTLQTQANLDPVWNAQPSLVQSMLQFKFKCCGYSNSSVFLKDATCPNASVAAKLGPCAVPFAGYANNFLDVVFTTLFGFVAVDVVLLLSALCVIKERRTEARYRLIDEKSEGRLQLD